MKKVLSIVFIFLVYGLGFSQNLKFGHINSDLLISLMPETKKAEKEMTAIAKTYENEFKGMMDEYQAKAKKYQSEMNSKSDAINQSRMKEMQDIENRLQQYRQTVSQETEKKKFDLMTPIIDKAQKAIDDVAKQNGLIYVFDVSKGGVIYVDSKVSIDLIDEVKKKLNITTAK